MQKIKWLLVGMCLIASDSGSVKSLKKNCEASVSQISSFQLFNVAMGEMPRSRKDSVAEVHHDLEKFLKTRSQQSLKNTVDVLRQFRFVNFYGPLAPPFVERGNGWKFSLAQTYLILIQMTSEVETLEQRAQQLLSIHQQFKFRTAEMLIKFAAIKSAASYEERARVILALAQLRAQNLLAVTMRNRWPEPIGLNQAVQLATDLIPHLSLKSILNRAEKYQLQSTNPHKLLSPGALGAYLLAAD